MTIKLKIRSTLVALAASALWLLGIPAAASAFGTFAPKTEYPTGHVSTSVAVGNFDLRQRADVASLSFGDNTVSILLNEGDGTLAAPVDYPAGVNPVGAVTGRFNGDRTIDLAILNRGGMAFDAPTVTLLLARPNGTFRAPRTFALRGTPRDITRTQLNRDGRLDLVIAGAGNGQSVGVLYGRPGGQFSGLRTLPTGEDVGFARSAAVGDFNRDGRRDIVVGNDVANNLSFLLGARRGQFRLSRSHPAVGENPVDIAAARLNRDRRTDVVVLSQMDGIASVFLGEPQPMRFRPRVDYETGTDSISMVLARLNAGRVLDLAVDISNNASVLIGRPNGTFAPRTEYPAGFGIGGIGAGQLNADSGIDLVTTGTGDNVVAVLLNQP